MISITEVVVVEGRYDRHTVSQAVSSAIVETSGFGVFSDSEKLALLRRLAEKRGLVVLTDSDGAGFVIRNYLKGAIDPKLVKHAYIPEIRGKERRKAAPSKEGTLGVEGMKSQVIEEALLRAGVTLEDKLPQQQKAEITKADLFALGLSGGGESSQKRRELQKRLGLPEKLSANAFLDVINAIMSREDFMKLI